jgi:formamidopyrimidine-DNA glycosylase
LVRCEGERGDIDLAVHLGMTGSLMWTKRAPDVAVPHLHARWELSGGAELRLVDPRRFGYVFVGAPDAVLASLAIGPDALAITPAQLARALRGRRAPVKSLLLDQHVVSGLGNIYVDESLFLARVHPLVPGGRAAAHAGRILSSARLVLERAIAARGTTFRDFRRADGSAESFRSNTGVWTEEPCTRCRA